ncbi:MerR family transcriptional regulator [Paenibacillus maysiensis]|uniref:MerR family transcriptional regulator n=1 Tax=Paenibacillus maysiensis TaxID=1155954 RepID=UPI000471179D|nr:MerR family transcriptional regulator [Paenibacillus maysiensis]
MAKYSIGEVAKITNLSVYTLRYYEQVGLLSFPNRKSNEIRTYTEDDVDWIKFLIRLKRTGMSISEMRNYSVLRKGGPSTIKERIVSLRKQQEIINFEIETLEDISAYIEEKINIYLEMERRINEE